jgi:hypothetical protein
MNSTFEVDIETLDVYARAPMNVKRVGHAVCYVPAIFK